MTLGPGRESARIPPRTVPSGWTRNSNEVATPKLPPPPAIAQDRSLVRFTRGEDLAGGGDDIG